MSLNFQEPTDQVSNRLFTSRRQDSVTVYRAGVLERTPVVFHGRSHQTGNLTCLIEAHCQRGDLSLAHTLEFEDRAVYVLAGSITAHLATGDHTLLPGQLLWEPHGTRRAYTVVGDGAQLLLLHSPGTQLPSFLETGCAVHTPTPEDAGRFAAWAARCYGVHLSDSMADGPSESVSAVPEPAIADEQTADSFAEPVGYVLTNRVTVSRGDDRLDSGQGGDGPMWTFHLGGHQTGGAMGVMEFTWVPGDVRPFHTHTLESRSILVLDGSVEVVLADQMLDGARSVPLGRGEMVWIPRGAKHAYRVGSAGARVLMTYFPGTRLDQMYRITASASNLLADPERAQAWVAWTARNFGVEFDLDTPVPG